MIPIQTDFMAFLGLLMHNGFDLISFVVVRILTHYSVQHNGIGPNSNPYESNF